MDTLSENSDVVIARSRNGKHRQDDILKECCRALTASHYDSFELLFERDWNFCNNGYFVADAGILTGFILTADHRIPNLGLTVFLGLSAGNGDRVGQAQTVKAYALALLDAASSKPRVNYIWGTTISPVIYLAASSYLSEFFPVDGIPPTSEQVLAIQSIVADRRSWGWPTPQGESDFVLRGVSTTVRYAKAEAMRLEAMRAKVPIFDSLDVREDRGDRLIFLGRPPAPQGTKVLVSRLLRTTRIVNV